MNMQAQNRQTAAETALLDSYNAQIGELPGNGAVISARDRLVDDLKTNGLPTRRVEAWHYTDLRSLLREAKPLADAPDDGAKSAAEAQARFLDAAGCRQLVFIDGRFVAELSDLAALEPSLTLRPLSEALAAVDEPILSQFGRLLPVQDATVDLNTALMSDGMIIHVAAGAKIERPLHLLFIAGAVPAASFARSLVIVERGAAATIVTESADTVSSYTSPSMP